MPEIKIDRGKPLPRFATGKTKYPWRKMAVGESFFVPGPRFTHVGMANQRFGPKRFVSRRDNQEGVTGSRIWREE